MTEKKEKIYITINKSKLEQMFKGLDQDFNVIGVTLYDSFIKLFLRCKICDKSHERKLYFKKQKEHINLDKSEKDFIISALNYVIGTNNDNKIIDKSKSLIDKISDYKPKQNKGFPCKVCGTYNNVNAYSVKYPDGSYPKCNPSFCDNCIPIVKQRHHDLLYTRIEKNNTISNEDLSSGDL